MTLGTTELLLVMLTAILGLPAAGALHELTHALFVWPVSDSVTVHWREQYVEAVVPRSRWRQRWADLAGVAPVIVGVMTAIYLLHIGSPLKAPTTIEGAVQWSVWMVYTTFGAVTDYIPEASREHAAAN